MKHFKILVPLLVLAIVNLKAQRPNILNSPEVHSNHSITFRLYERNARRVWLNAQFLKAPALMSKDTSGVTGSIVMLQIPDVSFDTRYLSV